MFLGAKQGLLQLANTGYAEALGLLAHPELILLLREDVEGATVAARALELVLEVMTAHPDTSAWVESKVGPFPARPSAAPAPC